MDQAALTPVTVCLPDTGGREFAATVRWQCWDDRVDAALLEVTGDDGWQIPQSLTDLLARPPQRYGLLVGTRPHPVTATGFPCMQKDPDNGERWDEQLSGCISPGTGALAGRYEITSTDPTPRTGSRGPVLEPVEPAVLLTPGGASERLLDSPAALLRADAEAVTFHGRSSELPDHDTPPDFTSLPLLIVVDYAETRPRLLRRLITRLHPSRHRVRLLLLARYDNALTLQLTALVTLLQHGPKPADASQMLEQDGIALPALIAAATPAQQAQIITVLACAIVAHYNTGRTKRSEHLLRTLDTALDTTPLTHQAIRSATAALPHPSHITPPLALRLTSSLSQANQQLAHDNPAAFEPDFAASLSNLGIQLSQAGRHDEVLPVLRTVSRSRNAPACETTCRPSPWTRTRGYDERGSLTWKVFFSLQPTGPSASPIGADQGHFP